MLVLLCSRPVVDLAERLRFLGDIVVDAIDSVLGEHTDLVVIHENHLLYQLDDASHVVLLSLNRRVVEALRYSSIDFSCGCRFDHKLFIFHVHSEVEIKVRSKHKVVVRHEEALGQVVDFVQEFPLGDALVFIDPLASVDFRLPIVKRVQ